jgi:hypothetical protein
MKRGVHPPTAPRPLYLQIMGSSVLCPPQLADLVELALMLQNLFDDVAALLERLQVRSRLGDSCTGTHVLAAWPVLRAAEGSRAQQQGWRMH